VRRAALAEPVRGPGDHPDTQLGCAFPNAVGSVVQRVPVIPGERLEVRSRVAGQRALEAKDEQIAVLTAALEAALERERRLELRLAEVGRRLSMDSADSGTPSSTERIGAKEARRARQQSERERRKDRFSALTPRRNAARRSRSGRRRPA